MENRDTIASQVGRLIWGGFEGKVAPDALLQAIERGDLGGIILFTRNIEDEDQVKGLVETLKAAAINHPLWVSIDQEGGRVQRLKGKIPHWPAMREVGRLGDLELTKKVGQGLGRDLVALGIDIDFAPVVDVVDNEENTVIGDRAFSADPQQVAIHGAALAAGLRAEGVIPCAKHFPGHGGPIADSHLERPVDTRTKDALEKQDVLPFIEMIKQGIELIMVAHVNYPALDENHPATFSSAIVQSYLRSSLGYQGLIVSDDMEMGAMIKHHRVEEASEFALRAGIDIILICHRYDYQQQTLAHLKNQILKDESFAARIAESIARLDKLKKLNAEIESTSFALNRHGDILSHFSK